jgi:hypothetical protein
VSGVGSRLQQAPAMSFFFCNNKLFVLTTCIPAGVS